MDPRIVRFEGFEGIHLVADVWGDDRDWPVLLMHGGGQTRHAWGNTARVLAGSGWRAVSLDLRGHGDSEWAVNGDYSFTANAADCVAITDQLGRPPVLVGASLGGVTGMLAEGGSDRVVSTGLVIVDVTHRTNPAGVQRIRDFMSSGVRGFASLEEAADAIAAYTPHRPKRMNPPGLMKVLRQKRDGRWYWHWDPRLLDHGRTEVPRRDFEALFQAAMRNIHVPTLLVRGKLSDVVTEEGVREFLAQIPGAKLADVGGAARTWWRATRMMRSPSRSSSFSSTTFVRPYRIGGRVERCFGRLHRSIRFAAGARATRTRGCGAEFKRWVPPEEADEDLLRSALLAFEN